MSLVTQSDKCKCNYPCSCVSYRGRHYASIDAVVADLEHKLECIAAAAAGALERVEVCDGTSGACGEAEAILSRVVQLDGTLVD